MKAVKVTIEVTTGNFIRFMDIKGIADNGILDVHYRFVLSDKSLKEFSREATNNPSDYGYTYLKRISANEGWIAERKRYKQGIVPTWLLEYQRKRDEYFGELRDKLGSSPITVVERSPEERMEVLKSAERIRETIDAADSLIRHVRMAKALIGSCSVVLRKINVAIASKTQDEINRLPIETLTKLLNNVALATSKAAQIERYALGLEEPLIKITNNLNQVEINEQTVKMMSDEELERLVSAED